MLELSMKEMDQLVIFDRLKKGEISQRGAATTLRCSVRWVRKKYKRYKQQGAEGLVHRSRGKPSHRLWDAEQKDKAMALFEGVFSGFGPTFAAQKLEAMYGIKINRETLRKNMIKHGHWLGRKRKIKHREQRERKSYFGEMVQLDGSPHDWFEGRGPRCTLINFIDDATSAIIVMMLIPSESTKGVMSAFRTYVEQYGRPLSLYIDFGSVFRVNTNNPENDKITQFGRLCKELDVTMKFAHSPQAKGRVERSHGTQQDRLIKELRLANINTVDEANKFIREVYIPQHNQSFARPAAKEGNVHRPINGFDLNTIFCLKETRILQNDFTLQYKKRIVQLNAHQQAVIRPKEIVTIHEHFDETIALFIRSIPLHFTELQTRPIKQRPQPVIRNDFYIKPAANHPWRCYPKKLSTTVGNGGY